MGIEESLDASGGDDLQASGFDVKISRRSVHLLVLMQETNARSPMIEHICVEEFLCAILKLHHAQVMGGRPNLGDIVERITRFDQITEIRSNGEALNSSWESIEFNYSVHFLFHVAIA